VGSGRKWLKIVSSSGFWWLGVLNFGVVNPSTALVTGPLTVLRACQEMKGGWDWSSASSWPLHGIMGFVISHYGFIYICMLFIQMLGIDSISGGCIKPCITKQLKWDIYRSAAQSVQWLGYELDDRGSIPVRGSYFIFYLATASILDLGPTQHLHNGHREIFPYRP
jgi:hypothetical protein